MKLTSIIVDDEPLARENLSMLLAEYCPEIEVLQTAGGVTEARQLIRTLKPQVVFLDIRMPSGAEGFDLLEEITNYPFLVVFVTAFKDYAIQAFNANAVHYILKPVDIDDLQNAVKKLTKQAAEHKEDSKFFTDYLMRLETLTNQLKSQGSVKSKKIAIHHLKGIRLVSADEIVFIQADGNCSFIQLSDQNRILDTQTLKVYEDLLAGSNFLRVHRSYLVNLDYVKEFLRDPSPTIIMQGNFRIPISRKRINDFVSSISST